MTGTAGPQKSGDSLPTAAACWMPQQRELSTGYVPGGHPGTTPGHPSPTGTNRTKTGRPCPPHTPDHRSG